MSKEAMGYISEKDLEELVAEENLAGGTCGIFYGIGTMYSGFFGNH